jgi:outer membrane biosynthesis protein TonB
MASLGMSTLSFRREQAELMRLAWALAISIVLHLLAFGVYEAGKKLNLWQQFKAPAWMQSAKMLSHLLQKPAQKKMTDDEQPPLVFVEVNPAAATADAPKDAPFYSDKNSRAANPEADQDQTIPKIAGKQTEVPKTEDVPREQFRSLQPSRPAPQAQQDQEEIKARSAQPPGDLALARPEAKPRTDPGQAARPRPRTIKEALARQNPAANRIPGEMMKQEGGVRRRLEFAALDAKASPFGSYDAALIAAISQRWYSLLDERDYASDSHGKVVLQFRMHYDGRVTDMNVVENTAGEMLGLICQKAVLDPAPFAPWPGEMRRLIGDTRSIQFTFYYH